MGCLHVGGQVSAAAAVSFRRRQAFMGAFGDQVAYYSATEGKAVLADDSDCYRYLANPELWAIPTGAASSVPTPSFISCVRTGYEGPRVGSAPAPAGAGGWFLVSSGL
jgi:hypothetical protein